MSGEEIWDVTDEQGVPIGLTFVRGALEWPAGHFHVVAATCVVDESGRVLLKTASRFGATDSAARRCRMTTTYEVPTSPAITWGYRRKSSLQQSYERLPKALRDLGIPEERVLEDAMSGKKMNRPGWQSLLSHVRPNDVVWVDGLDRLGRSTLATLQAMEELEQRGVRVRSAKPGEDLQGATGELIRQIMLVMAQWERRQMLERVAEARAARVAAGLPTGRPKTALSQRQVRHI